MTSIPIVWSFSSIVMLKSMTGLLGSFANQLTLQAADDTHIDGTVTSSTEMRQKNASRALLNLR